MAGDGQPGLPPFQLEVARMFFALPASRGFLLAGGAALLAQHLTARPTEDLDFLPPQRGHVPAARDALEARPVSGAGLPSGSTHAARPHRSLGQFTPAQADTCPPEPVNLAEQHRIRRKQVLRAHQRVLRRCLTARTPPIAFPAPTGC